MKDSINSRILAARIIGKFAGERTLLQAIVKRTPAQERRLNDLNIIRRILLKNPELSYRVKSVDL